MAVPDSAGLDAVNAGEVRATLALALARGGWPLRVELDPDGVDPRITVTQATPRSGSSRIRFPLTHDPAPVQADRMLRALAAAGWTPATSETSDLARPLIRGAAWCAPE